MRALLCTKYGPAENLEVATLPTPEPGSGEVRVRVRAAGINFPDSLVIAGKYQFKPEPPFSPGGEAVGVIDALGAGVTGWKVGDRVLAIQPYGLLREEVVLPVESLVPVPAGLDDVTAAGFLLTWGTSHYALTRRGQLKHGETLAVLGAAGGVGLAAIQLGKALGARVIACASSEEKLAFCREQGADATVNYGTEKLSASLKKLTDGNGVDVVYDPVGGPYTEEAVRAMAWGGRTLIVGFASGTIPALPLNLTLLKSCSITGVFWGAFTIREREAFVSDLEALGVLLESGKIRPQVTKTFPLERAAEAISSLSNRSAIGKLVVTL